MIVKRKTLRPREKKKGKKQPTKRVRLLNTLRENVSLAPSVALRVRSKKPTTGSVKLTKCSTRYALSIADPFNVAARGACIPVNPIPSYKVHAFTRFDLTIGTGGYAVLLFSPSVTSDLPSVLYTNGSYAGSSAGLFNPWATYGTLGTTNGTLNTGWQFGYLNCPYNSTQVTVEQSNTSNTNAATLGRMVSFGARVQYVGTTLNESGMYTCYHDLEHASIAGNSLANIQSFAEADVSAVTRAPCMLSMFAVNDTELSYPTPLVPFSQNAAVDMVYPFSGSNPFWSNTPGSVVGGLPVINTYYNMGAPTAVIVASGVAGSVVHVECIGHLEYAGALAGTGATTSEDDPVGAAHVRSAASRLVGAKLANPKASTWSVMYEGLKMAAKAAVPYIVPAAEGALAALLL